MAKYRNVTIQCAEWSWMECWSPKQDISKHNSQNLNEFYKQYGWYHGVFMDLITILWLFYFSYLFLAALGLPGQCAAFLQFQGSRLLLLEGHGLLTALASLVVEHRLQTRGLQQLRLTGSSCGTQDYLLHGMRNLPGPRIKPVTLALAGRFLSTITREVHCGYFRFNIWGSQVNVTQEKFLVPVCN